MGIRILDGGLLTTVQDKGRTGYQKSGMPVAGAMDAYAMNLANILVGNNRSSAVLEVTVQGPSIEFTEANVIAVCGGNLSPQLSGAPLPMNRAVSVRAGETLSFGAPIAGCRCYIAFAGGMDIPLVMSSRSTYLKAGLGGFQGRRLQKGDEIAFAAPRAALPGMEARIVPDEMLLDYRQEADIRIVLGPQDDYFTEYAMMGFFHGFYTVTNACDRMGYRLEGRKLPHVQLEDGNIISDGVAFGSIQIPPDGLPIIMMADHQTTGGYTKVGAVITVDLPLVANMQPGAKIHFVQVEIDEAQFLLRERAKALSALDDRLNAALLAEAPAPEKKTESTAATPALQKKTQPPVPEKEAKMPIAAPAQVQQAETPTADAPSASDPAAVLRSADLSVSVGGNHYAIHIEELVP